MSENQLTVHWYQWIKILQKNTFMHKAYQNKNAKACFTKNVRKKHIFVLTVAQYCNS